MWSVRYMFRLSGMIALIVSTDIKAGISFPSEACCDCNVVLLLPSLIVSCGQTGSIPSDRGVATIYNVTDVYEIAFTVPDPVDYRGESNYDLWITAEENDGYVFAATRGVDSTTYTLRARGDRLGPGTIDLDVYVQVRSCSCVIEEYPRRYEFCEREPAYIVPVSLEARDIAQRRFPVRPISGGVFSRWYSDVANSYVKGKVYYSDGVTRVHGAELDAFYIADVRAEPCEFSSLPTDASGRYRLCGFQFPRTEVRLEDEYITLEVRFRGPEKCGVCSNLESVLWNLASKEAAELDVVLPATPPSASPTPPMFPSVTPTPAPTVSNPRSDIDRSGVVDVRDLFIFQDFWQEVADTMRMTQGWSPVWETPPEDAEGAEGEGGDRRWSVLEKTDPFFSEKAAPDSWTMKAPMPTAREYCSAAVIDEKIYVLGGGELSRGITDINEVFDPATDTWSAAAPMSVSRARFGAGAMGGRVYALGGFIPDNGTTRVDLAETYDPTTDKWSAILRMPTARTDFAVGVARGRLYAIGGRGSDGTHLATVEEFDPSKNRWCIKSSMPSPRSLLAVACVCGKVYALGGIDPDFNELDTVDEYDPTTDTWTHRASMLTARRCLAAGSVGDRIYAIGGQDPISPFPGTTAANEEYNPVTDTWVSRATMLTARRRLTAGVVNDRIYAIAGSPLESTSTNNQEYTPPEFAPTSTPTETGTPPPSPTPSPTWTFDAGRPDIDESGRVNALDLLILLEDWKKVSGP